MTEVENKIELYNYQKDATHFVLMNIMYSNVLLAAAPNAGKTLMASFIIKNLISLNNRILCSVHGTNVLKKQFYDSVCRIIGEENVSIYNTEDLSLYDPSKPVQIMIYQNIRQMKECVDLYGKFDYLIVDEAHKFYYADSMNTVSKEYVSGNHLLLTGSPAIFKEKVDSGEIRAKYISASLIESNHSGQYDRDIILDVVSNDVHLTLEDYNQDGEVIKKSESKLNNNKVVLESLLVGNFGKTIIYVKRTSQANEIETYLNSRNIDNFVSHSNSDKDSKNIDLFKEGYSGVDDVVLIVVGRATEGFDDPNVSIIDLTYTKNIDTLTQRYARAIRKRTDAPNKRYVKVVPNNGNSAQVYIHIMTAVLMLLKQEHYENFNGKNFSIPTYKPDVIKEPKEGVGKVRTYVTKKNHETNDINDNNIIIKSSDNPVSVEDLVNNDNFNVSVEIEGKSYEITKNDYNEWVDKLSGKDYLISIEKTNDKVDDDLLMETSLYSGSFFDTKNELYGLITRYATSSLQDVLREINSEYLSTDEHIRICIENNLISNNLYQKYRIDRFDLRSHPNIPLNISNGDFFKKVREELGVKGQYEYDVYSIEECIEIALNLNIKNSRNWRDRHSEISNITNKKIPHSPWKKFDLEGGATEFSNLLGWDSAYDVDNITEIVEICKKHNILSPNQWVERYKEVSDLEDIRLMVRPWETFKLEGGKKEFSKLLGYDYDVDNIDDCLTLGKKYNIKTSSQWYKRYAEIVDNENIKLPSSPWEMFKLEGGATEFSRMLGYNDNFLGIEEHFKICVDNLLTSSVKYSNFQKKSDLKLYTNIWDKVDLKSKDYFSKVKESLGLEISNNEIVKICVDNLLTSGSKYKNFRINNNNLHSRPWNIVSKTEGQYFQEIRDIIDEKLKIEREYKPAYLGEFSEMNKKWNTSNSNTTHQKLLKDKSEWVKYHELYSNARKNWNEIPYKEIGKILKNRPEWVVGDFGCGENLLKTEIPNKVISFDHISIDDSVISCDLTNVPLDDEVLDVVVFSLSLMGTNYNEYMKEAYRTLKPMGMIIISEPVTRWEDKEESLKELLIESGFTISGDIKHTEKFIYITSIKI
jgi:superfamily II DNA or RNA helicase